MLLSGHRTAGRTVQLFPGIWISSQQSFSRDTPSDCSELENTFSLRFVYIVMVLRNMLSPIFSEHCVRSAVLLGSHYKGQATEHSDVDLLVHSGLRGLAFRIARGGVCPRSTFRSI